MSARSPGGALASSLPRSPLVSVMVGYVTLKVTFLKKGKKKRVSRPRIELGTFRVLGELLEGDC